MSEEMVVEFLLLEDSSRTRAVSPLVEGEEVLVSL